MGGWWIGARGGRPFLERHGRWLHLNDARLEKAERWFERWEDFHHAFHYVDYTIAALIVAGAAYLAWKFLRRRGRPAIEPR